jgi:hypothetical protein
MFGTASLFVGEVRLRYVEGVYRRSEISFTIRFEHWAEVWSKPGADRDFSQVMRQSLAGRDMLASAYHSDADGLPVWLYKKYGISAS